MGLDVDSTITDYHFIDYLPMPIDLPFGTIIRSVQTTFIFWLFAVENTFERQGALVPPSSCPV